jgi:uncharacterized protein YbcI
MPPANKMQHPPDGGELGAAISNKVVHVLADYTGRGPTQARTSIREDLVVVMLQDTLTKGERALVRNGRAEKVIDLRGEFQAAMRAELVTAVEELTGRSVTAFMSANHIEPDLAAEIFVLAPV